jgi:hypothetical protein
MKTAGGSTRQRAKYSALALSVAMLIALREFGATARAADVTAAADTASAAALYEPLPPASAGTSAAGKSAVSTSPASIKSSAATADPSAPSESNTDQAPAPAVTTETVIVPASMPAPSYSRLGGGLRPSTPEIPQPTGGPEPGTAEIDRNVADAEAINYEARLNPQQIDPKLRSLQDFISEGDESSSLGVDLREEQRKLNSGEVANGLLIVGVRDGSPAAQGGLHASRHTARNVATGLAVAASLVFPPAVLAVPLLEQVNLGDSYDMIIGVDGTRVTNFMDFEDSLRYVQPGEIVYLSIVRNGDRVQVPVHVGSLTIAPF